MLPLSIRIGTIRVLILKATLVAPDTKRQSKYPRLRFTTLCRPAHTRRAWRIKLEYRKRKKNSDRQSRREQWAITNALEDLLADGDNPGLIDPEAEAMAMALRQEYCQQIIMTV